MTRSMGDDEGPVEVHVAPRYMENLKAMIEEATEAWIYADFAVTDEQREEFPELDLDELAKFNQQMTRTPWMKFKFLIEHEVCPWHLVAIEVCLDDGVGACQGMWNLMKEQGA